MPGWFTDALAAFAIWWGAWHWLSNKELKRQVKACERLLRAAELVEWSVAWGEKTGSSGPLRVALGCLADAHKQAKLSGLWGVRRRQMGDPSGCRSERGWNRKRSLLHVFRDPMGSGGGIQASSAGGAESVGRWQVGSVMRGRLRSLAMMTIGAMVLFSLVPACTPPRHPFRHPLRQLPRLTRCCGLAHTGFCK